MDSSNSFSGLRVALLLVGGSSEVEGAVASLSLAVFSMLVLVSHGENLGDEELDTQCFSEGDSIGGGSVSVKAAVPVPCSEIQNPNYQADQAVETYHC